MADADVDAGDDAGDAGAADVDGGGGGAGSGETNISQQPLLFSSVSLFSETKILNSILTSILSGFCQFHFCAIFLF